MEMLLLLYFELRLTTAMMHMDGVMLNVIVSFHVECSEVAMEVYISTYISRINRQITPS